jgi:hypothetical protein
MVWTPKVIGNNLNKYAPILRLLPIKKILFQYSFSSARTKTKVANAIPSGIPTKINTGNVTFIKMPPFPKVLHYFYNK